MSLGLLGLLDDVASLAKVAAASIDDVAGQAVKAGVKAAGVVIDDAAVTPRYVIGFSAARELSIVWKIAVGSLRNKLLFLLPAALVLSLLAPWAITPLLMLGGAYLCYEGAEKAYESLMPHHLYENEIALDPLAIDSETLEHEKVASAIRTDFILSAEIMAITLAAVPAGSFLTQALVLIVVGFGITVAVYSTVALIVKADDIGLALAKTNSASVLGALTRALGRGVVRGMPIFLTFLSVVGTAAMTWVGGGIIVHGLEAYGLPWLSDAIHVMAEAAGHALTPVAGFAEWIVTAAGLGIVGLMTGAAIMPVVEYFLVPAWKRFSSG